MGSQAKAYKPDTSTNPWHPFHVCLDFEFSELVLEATISKEQINHFLKLMKSACCGSEPFTLNDYGDLCSMW
ncbi:hypothetical protein EDC04DRAFT_2575548 [Pisolithus marmoratus]|nr:hypothetical protein EDC04DRAFT_2575548 [Pisolithus marmoratus]